VQGVAFVVVAPAFAAEELALPEVAFADDAVTVACLDLAHADEADQVQVAAVVDTAAFAAEELRLAVVAVPADVVTAVTAASHDVACVALGTMQVSVVVAESAADLLLTVGHILEVQVGDHVLAQAVAAEAQLVVAVAVVAEAHQVQGVAAVVAAAFAADELHPTEVVFDADAVTLVCLHLALAAEAD
jgi:hypothetical protein